MRIKSFWQDLQLFNLTFVLVLTILGGVSFSAGSPPGGEIAAPLNPLTSDIRPLIEQGMIATLNNEFDTAEELFSRLIERYPEEPFGYFYYAALLQAEMMDREDYSQANQAFDYLEKCLDRCDKRLAKNERDIWAIFYKGSAYLYRSVVEGKLHNWLPAYRFGSKGAKLLEQCIQHDSTFYEAYLGVGSYKYWKSSKAGFLRLLPLISDEREVGMEMVKKAIRNGKLVSWVARDQLVWIYLDAERYAEAVELARENVQSFPHSRFFRWSLMKAYWKAKRWNEAEPILLDILKEFQSLPENNHYNETVCLYSLGKIAFEREDYSKADQYFSCIFKIRFSPEIRKRLKDRLEDALELWQECRRHLAGGARSGMPSVSGSATTQNFCF